MSIEEIARRLSEYEGCGISFEGFKKRIHHWDTCTEIGKSIGLKTRTDKIADLSTQLTQTETRKYRRLTNQDRKRVLDSFRTRYTNGNGKREVRNVFREAMRKVDPVILQTPKTTKKVSKLPTPPLGLFEGETPDYVSLSNEEKPQLPVIQRGHSTIDVNQMLPSPKCNCRDCQGKDGCYALILYRQHMAKVYS